MKNNKINCQPIIAILMLLALVWAIWTQELRYLFFRPVLRLNFYEIVNPHLRYATGVSHEKESLRKFKGHFITLQLINTGRTTARNTEPLLTALGHKDLNSNWQRDNKWIAIPLRWVLVDEHKVLKRDLVPYRPHLFNLGSFSNESKRYGKFLLDYTMSPIDQTETVDPGEHCFEITIFAEGAKPTKKYIYIEFKDFRDVQDPDGIKQRVKKIYISDRHPW